MKVEVAVRMEEMVTSNIETDLDVANGAQGEIVKMILHPDEPPIGNEPVVELKRLPVCVLVKLRQTQATQLEGLEDCVILVEPKAIRFQIKAGGEGNRKGKHTMVAQTITQKEYPITAAYAFTNY